MPVVVGEQVVDRTSNGLTQGPGALHEVVTGGSGSSTLVTAGRRTITAEQENC